MSFDSKLFAEFVESVGLENVEIFGRDDLVFSELKKQIPIGLNKPDFSSLPIYERLDYPHEKQVSGEHLTKFIQEVIDRFTSLVGNADGPWILVGDGATEKAYRFPKESLNLALEVFVLYPNSVIAVQADCKAGLFFDMTWSASIFSIEGTRTMGTMQGSQKKPRKPRGHTQT